MRTKIFGDIVRKKIVELNEKASKTLASAGRRDQISQVPSIRRPTLSKKKRHLVGSRQMKVAHPLAENNPELDVDSKPELEVNKDDEKNSKKAKAKRKGQIVINPEIEGQTNVYS